MRELFINIIKNSIALLLSGVILFPLFYELGHYTEEHEHTICTDHSNTHFHSLDIECSIIKQKPSQEVYVVYTAPNYADLPEPTSKNFNYYNFISEYQRLHFSLRGPPLFHSPC